MTMLSGFTSRCTTPLSWTCASARATPKGIARSIGGEIALPFGAWYYASKHALEAFSDTLRMEVEPFGIDVVIIQPGIIKTEFEDQTSVQLRENSGRGAYREMAEAMARHGETGLSDGSDPSVVVDAIRRKFGL